MEICSHNLHLRPCFNRFYFSKKVVCCVLTFVISLLKPCKGYRGQLCGPKSYFIQKNRKFPSTVISGRWNEALQNVDGNGACRVVPPPKTCDWNWVPLALSVFALHSFVCGISEKFLESDHRLKKITSKTRAVVRLCLVNERMYCTFSHHN